MARTGGQLVVDCLEAQGVDTVFGVPGESYLAVLDALHDSAVRFVLCRQEGGAAFMAEAWGKLTGRPGVCFVTRGPGATNASIGVHTAMQDSTPMVLFIGQVARSMRGREAFQEVDYRAMFGPLAKWAVEIDAADRVPEIVARAFATALSGRPGPVVVALPEDMLVETSDAAPCGPSAAVWPGVDAGAVARTVEALAAAERPLAMIGGGGWDCGHRPGRDGVAAFVEAAAEAGIPVTATFRRQDLVDSASPAWIGDAGLGKAPGVRRAIAEADLVLAVNVRFSENTTDGYTNMAVPVPGQRLIHVHPDAAELGKIYQGGEHVQAAPDGFLAALAGRGMAARGGRAAWASGLRAEYEASLDLPEQAGPVDMRAVMAHLREVLGPDAIITNGAGNFAIWPGKQFGFRPGQRWLAPQAGAMGAGLPAAIAARLARPEAPVVCFAGDGDLQMTIQELGTGMQHGANPVVLLLNNGCYGTIRMHQEREYPGRVSGTAIVNPDYPAIARAYGMWATRLDDASEFPDAFATALAAEGGGLIEIPVDPEQITPGRRLSQIRG